MENITEYVPLDYRAWILGDKAREGVNIKRLGVLNENELRLLDSAIPFQDMRNDPGQAEIVAYFASKLIDLGMPGEREVAIPSAILHDTGWYKQGDPNSWKKRVEAGLATEGESIRRPAQNRAIYIAGMLLPKALDLPEEKQFEIADIIGDHDTQLLPTTQSGLVLRCADMLWRFSYPHNQIYRPKVKPEEVLSVMEGKDGLGKFLNNENLRGGYDLQDIAIAVRLARIELVNSLYFKYGECASDALGDRYSDELDIVKTVYSEKLI